MATAAPESAPLLPAEPRRRIASIDAFRGLTIFLMIFVIRVAGYNDLPLTFPHFGSTPVSTFKHCDSESPRAWAYGDNGTTATHSKHYRAAIVAAHNADGTYDVRLLKTTQANGKPDFDTVAEKGSKFVPRIDTDVTTVTAVRINTPKSLPAGESIVARVNDQGQITGYQATKIGCTVCDLVAPFFVFIVGVCIPLSKAHRGGGWFGHALQRTLFLIAAGVLYLSLIAPLSLSYWWGILQAIGAAYFMGVILLQLKPAHRILALAAIAGFHELMTRQFHCWTELGDPSLQGFSLTRWRNNVPTDPWRPLELHCTPWGSIGYGICTVFGTFIGDAIKARTAIVQRCLVVGVPCVIAGLVLNYTGFPMHKEFVTASYAIFTSGVAALTYLAFYAVMDIAGFTAWAWPLTVFGQNALFAYFSQVLIGGAVFERIGIGAFFGGAPFPNGVPEAARFLANANFFIKTGWTAMFWGLLYTFLLWLATLYANRRGWIWKL